jgi:prepilin-type N-terminal cleavage/methylation domain-containing protein
MVLDRAQLTGRLLKVRPVAAFHHVVALSSRLRMVTQTHSKPRGFTLIELMVTVAIVAILASLAYPNYRNYVLRGQLVDATNGLSALRANMERYFQDNRTYAPTGTFVPPCPATSSPLVVGSFQLSCAVTPGATTFQAQAVGTGSTTGFIFTVDQDGTQSTTVTGVKGWKSCTNAWVTKAGQAC